MKTRSATFCSTIWRDQVSTLHEPASFALALCCLLRTFAFTFFSNYYLFYLLFGFACAWWVLLTTTNPTLLLTDYLVHGLAVSGFTKIWLPPFFYYFLVPGLAVTVAGCLICCLSLTFYYL